MFGQIFRGWKKEPKKEPQLLAEMKTASATYERYLNCFNFAESADQIEAAIYALKSAELEIKRLWKEAKQCSLT